MSDSLKLSKQVCFPLYALSKQVISSYRSLLQKLDLTYPQYLVMMILWEEKEQNVSELGNQLTLDSGTLTPLLKRLESKGLVSRTRNVNDERVVLVTITQKGAELRGAAENIPAQLNEILQLSAEDLKNLKSITEKVLSKIESNKKTIECP